MSKGKTPRCLKSLPSSLRRAFDKGHDQISFGIRENEYRFVADHDEWPLVKGMLFVADDKPDMWIPIADSGDEYIGNDLPESWRGLPDFMAEKITSAAGLHSLKVD
jgi:hypothetical protein